jgi:5-methylcytosine-specific restriction endonuclease McrA
MNKACKTCSEEKPLSAFGKEKRGRYGVRSSCKECRNIEGASWRAKNPTYHKEWREANREKKRASDERWRKNNLAIKNAANARYRAAKLQATPPWADMDAIRDVYLEAEYQQMQVDHIVPLQNEKVCGLHVWDNLQLLTAPENQSKNNTFNVG